MNELVLLRNELKNRIVPTYKLIGITSVIILSTDIFKHNDDIPEFLKNVYSLEFKDYVIRSRTTILARTCREIYKLDDDHKTQIKNKLYKFITNTVEQQNKH